ncbi:MULTISPECIES: hypothetical protein [unclassified Microcoleus]|uniref:hypothetical protein n=1 Tax=unclassified Microcoleus TaxID=2642155 RepID=UPI002FD3A178
MVQHLKCNGCNGCQEEGSSATDYVTDVTDVRKKEVRQRINWFPASGGEPRSRGSASLAKKQEAEQ